MHAIWNIIGSSHFFWAPALAWPSTYHVIICHPIICDVMLRSKGCLEGNLCRLEKLRVNTQQAGSVQEGRGGGGGHLLGQT